MVHRIRAHFDGRIIVPDEPVDLPRNQPLDVDLRVIAPEFGPDRALIEQRLWALGRLSGAVTAPPVPPEALRRESLYDPDQ